MHLPLCYGANILERRARFSQTSSDWKPDILILDDPRIFYFGAAGRFCPDIISRWKRDAILLGDNRVFWSSGEDLNLHSITAGGLQDRCHTIRQPERMFFFLYYIIFLNLSIIIFLLMPYGLLLLSYWPSKDLFFVFLLPHSFYSYS